MRQPASSPIRTTARRASATSSTTSTCACRRSSTPTRPAECAISQRWYRLGLGWSERSSGRPMGERERSRGTAMTQTVNPPRRSEDRQRGAGNVLVVDDTAENRELVGYCLRVAGYNVRGAATAREALAAIDGFQPDVAV